MFVWVWGFGGVGLEFALVWFILLGFFLHVPKFFIQLPRWLHAKSIHAKIIANQIFAHALSNCKIRVKMYANSALL